jgi:hypothetical protein
MRERRWQLDKQHLIIEIIAWNLDWNRFDHETGETELIAWILDTYKRLVDLPEETLRTLLYANSLQEDEEQEGSHA